LANPGAQVTTALTGALTTPSAKQSFIPPGSYDLITAYDLAATSTSINFNSIPQTYKHLEIRGVLQGTQGTNRGNTWQGFSLNDNSNAYDYATFIGYESGTATYSRDIAQSTLALGDVMYQGGDASGMQTFIIKINNYSDTTKIKNWTMWSGWCVSGATQNRIFYNTGVMRTSTSAITTIKFPNSNTSGYAIGSSLRLYGING